MLVIVSTYWYILQLKNISSLKPIIHFWMKKSMAEVRLVGSSVTVPFWKAVLQQKCSCLQKKWKLLSKRMRGKPQVTVEMSPPLQLPVRKEHKTRLPLCFWSGFWQADSPTQFNPLFSMNSTDVTSQTCFSELPGKIEYNPF